MTLSSTSEAHRGERAPLPSPADRPTADVVIYDGHCRLCVAQVRRMHGWDSRGRLAFLSLHDSEARRRFPDLSHDALLANMYVVDAAGARHRGAAAIRHLSRRLPRLYALAPLLHIPGSLPIWQWLYQQVARRRYGFGRVESCEDGACHRHGS